MARIRVVRQGFLYVLSANESDGGGVGSGDVTDKDGAITESADLITVTDNEECFSGPIHITEAGDNNKLSGTGEAAGASDAGEAFGEVHNTNQDQSESLGRCLEKLPSTSQKRRKRRATSRAPGSDTEQETKKSRRARSSNWTSEETQMMVACKLQPSLPRGEQGWEAIAAEIGTRNAKQCRQRWDTLQKRDNTTLPTSIPSGLAANEPNGASSTSHTVGKINLPSSACPTPEVSRPQLMPAAFSVERRPASFELEAPFLQPVAELPVVAQDQLPATSERPHPAMAADHLYDCNDPMSYWRRFFDYPDDPSSA